MGQNGLILKLMLMLDNLKEDRYIIYYKLIDCDIKLQGYQNMPDHQKVPLDHHDYYEYPI